MPVSNVTERERGQNEFLDEFCMGLFIKKKNLMIDVDE